jgi:hypothetical protein
MSFSQIVKTLRQPTVKLITLSDYDTSATGEGLGGIQRSKQLPDSSQLLGANRPFIKIGGQIVSNIESLVLDETSFIPTLTLVFTDLSGEFAGYNFPKRNLMAAVYIATSNDKFKPIRSDYLITKVRTLPSKSDESQLLLTKNTTYIINAELFVPRLYNNVSKSYSNSLSMDTLMNICTDLGLGYAQNDFTTNDAMTWINYNTSPLNFIREITNYTYSNDNAFFNGFINKELIFNLIEVNEQLKGLETDFTYINSNNPLRTNLTQESKTSTLKSQINDGLEVNFLTNLSQNIGRSNYIIEANLISNQGEILKRDGYLKKIYYYDHFDENEDIKKKFKDFYVTPLNTAGSDEITMLIPDDEGMAEIGNKKWMNINYGNTHENWNAARVFNTHNLKELDKIQLRVVTNGINFQIIRGSSIPVLMTMRLAETLRKNPDVNKERQVQPKETLESEVLDDQLSGRYYVIGVKYHYTPLESNQFSTEFFLARREWQPSKIIFTANA